MTFKIETLGCKVNQYDSQLIYEELVEKGLCEDRINPKVVIINSCTVTGEADHKTVKTVRRMRKDHPNCFLIVTGCMAETSKDALNLPEVDLVVGGKNKKEVVQAVVSYLENGKKDTLTLPLEKPLIWQRKAKGFSGHTRAFIRIQEGCQNYCSYCIIPTARGGVQYQPLDHIYEEVKGLVENGYQEIIFVGINLAMYGKGSDFDLADAVFTAAKVEGDFRIRLGSTEPELMTDRLLQRLQSCPKFCPSFHLPLQSGCDRTLKEMNRHYNTEAFACRVEAVRRIFGPLSYISTDVMVGFPGETEEDFQQTKAFCEAMAFSSAHVFSYSPRSGTVAANRTDHCTPETKSRRSEQLRKALQQSKIADQEKRIGSTVTVITEKGMTGGHDQYGNYVTFPHGITHPQGTKVTVTIKAYHQKGLLSE